MTTPNSTIRQRQLATRLRELRSGSGMSIADVAAHLLCTPSKISRIETAKRRASLRDVRDLCNLYGVADNTELMALARGAREQEWWQDYDEVNFRPLLGLEAEASEITEYETTTIPGLLQTEDYARAVITGYLPKIEADILSDRIQARIKRQDLLIKADPPRYRILLDESALHRHVGGKATMREQLRRLVEVAQFPHVTVQVIPYTVGAHMGFDSAFMLLEFPKLSGVLDTVYIEHQIGHFFIENEEKVKRFRETIDLLRDEALSRGDSIGLISTVASNFTE